MNFFKINCILFLIIPSFTGYGQELSSDSIRQLKVVEVNSFRLSSFSNSNKIENFDSTLLDRYSVTDLADLLTNESQIFIKSYGLGSLATSSFRGASASHTAVLWNGFNLQSPMNGLIDFSLIPVNFMTNVKIQYGGAGALWGSGAVGGSIHLSSSPEYNKGITISTNTSFGSFLNKQQQVSAEISKDRFVTSVKLFNHDAKNDFPFINSAQSGKPLQDQTNAELKEYGLLQENFFRINEKQKLNTHFWVQFNDRNIPPSMTQNISVANQKDEFIRSSIDWQRTTEKNSIIAKAAYFDENLLYADSLIDLDTKSRTKVFITEAETKFSLWKLDLLNIGLNNTYSEASTEDYISDPHQNRFAVFASYKIHTRNDFWNVVLSGRQEFIEAKAIPFSPSIGIQGKFLKWFYLKLNAAKHYRVPTFNDLYWAQGGNPDLKPESGWSEEGSLEHRYIAKQISWEIGATVFNRDINNWIIWLPNNYGIWSPENMLQVWSRGLEYKLKVNIKKRKFNLQLSGLYNYVLSTNEKTATSTDASLGQQLIYVPIQNAQGNLTVGYRGAAISYTHIYVGYRYTTSDNTSYLKPYSVGNINFSQTFSLSTSKIKAFIQLNNVWQETYQVLAYRAMPLFNCQVGLSLVFNQPNEK